MSCVGDYAPIVSGRCIAAVDSRGTDPNKDGCIRQQCARFQTGDLNERLCWQHFEEFRSRGAIDYYFPNRWLVKDIKANTPDREQLLELYTKKEPRDDPERTTFQNSIDLKKTEYEQAVDHTMEEMPERYLQGLDFYLAKLNRNYAISPQQRKNIQSNLHKQQLRFFNKMEEAGE
jgi:hypothetical protein